MATYFEMNTDRFQQFLIEKGFEKTISFKELVYVRKHDKNKNLWIKVFTSVGMKTGVRECGGDAIRIVGIYSDGFVANNQFVDGKKNFALFKGKRVFRTTSQDSIEERTLIQMRLCYQRLNEYNKYGR